MNKPNVLHVEDERITVLKAIRRINQLIVSVDNAAELTQKACETLISTRMYSGAWIILINEDGTFREFVSAGLKMDSNRFSTALQGGFRPDCVRCLEEGLDACQVRHTGHDCGDCLLREAYPENYILSTRIRYKQSHWGYLTVTAPGSMAENSEEVELFTDISEDLGLALTNLDRIKKQEQVEKRLIRVLDDWESTFDAIPDLIAIIDTDHRIVKANKAMAAKLGHRVEDLTGRQCFDIVHGLPSIPDFCPHSRSMRSGKEENSEVMAYKRGEIYDVTTTPIFDEKGKLTGTVHVARDITIRKKKEQLMAENLALGEFALKQPLNHLVTMAIDKAEILTDSKIAFFHFVDEDETKISLQAWSTNTLKNFCAAEGNGMHYPIELAGIWADSLRERRPVIHNDYANTPGRKGLPEGHATVVRELTVPIIRAGKVVAILGVGNKPIDYDNNDVDVVTQLANLAWEYIISKRFEEALFKSEQYARALLDAIPDLIFRMTRDGTYLDYKAGKEDLYYQSASIIGKNNRDLTPSWFADLIEEKIKSTLDHGKLVLFEYQLPTPGTGMRDFEARMVPNGPDEITAIARDITDRKKVEEALKKKIDELEWFNHMMVDRELKMIDLKKEINVLLNRLGEEDKYVIHQKPHSS
ncbi:MAG: GAF domain-containing protein [Bacteroidetes bacterium]|nr:GAF domain-containing protein [Bacteroidota bacterium]